MKRRFAFFDVDQTIYNGFSTPAFYHHLAERELIDRHILKEDAELSEAYLSGKISYKEAGERVMQMLARYLKGKTEAEVAAWGKELPLQESLHQWVKPLIKRLKQEDFQIYLISGSVLMVVKLIGEYLKVNGVFATELEVHGGTYSGQIARHIDFAQKQALLHQIIEPKDKTGITLAFGDSSGDAFMLDAVDYPFLIDPHEPALIGMAKEHGWKLASNETVVKEVTQVLEKVSG